MSEWKALVEKIQAQATLDIPRTRFLRPGMDLRPYQKVGAFLLYLCKRFLLADDCGLGKTLQVLMSYAIQKHTDEKEKRPSPKLLVVTKTSSVLQWVEEVQHFFQDLTAQAVLGSNREDGFPSTASYRRYLYQTAEEDVLVVPHRTFVMDWETEAVLDVAKRSILVLDEATCIKEQESGTYKALQAASVKAQAFKALTATPIKRDLKDYYTLMQVICPGLFGSMVVFEKEFCIMQKIKTKQGRYLPVIKDFKNIPQFKARARHYLLMRTPKEVGEQLPEVLEKPIFLDMDPAQAKVYAEAEALTFNLLPDTLERRKGEDDDAYEKRIENTKESPMIKQLRMLQVSDHPKLVGVDAPSVKTQRLIEILQNELFEDQVVVFTRFRSCVDLLEEALGKAGIQTCRVTGQESPAEREAARKALMAPGPPYVMLVTEAGKEALNLQCAGTLIFYELPWTWGDFHQLIGRIRRIGSLRTHVLVMMLMIRGSIDEIIYRVLRNRTHAVTEATTHQNLMEVTPLVLEEILTRLKERRTAA